MNDNSERGENFYAVWCRRLMSSFAEHLHLAERLHPSDKEQSVIISQSCTRAGGY